jgi:hypothetical protein
MGRIEKTVFISYRRTNVPWALAIYQDLNQHGYDVFFDYTGIASGDFEGVILDNIRARAHFLVLLTPSALKRCSDPADWLRREIEAALDSQRNVVPLMLEGFNFGTPKIASQLTGKLAVLKQYNALSVPPEYFQEAMGRLRDRYLNVALDAVLQPASRSAALAAREEKDVAARARTVPQEELTAQQCSREGLVPPTLMSRCAFIVGPSTSSPTSPWVSTTEASPYTTKAIWRRRYGITTRPSAFGPMTPTSLSTVVSR